MEIVRMPTARISGCKTSIKAEIQLFQMGSSPLPLIRAMQILKSEGFITTASIDYEEFLFTIQTASLRKRMTEQFRFCLKTPKKA